MLRRNRLVFSLALVGGLVGADLFADTVFLKNGAYIDGIVTTRGPKKLMISIGSIGKIEIETELVSHIEKNSRTGSHERVPVDSRELQVPDELKQDDEDPAEGDADDGDPAEEPEDADDEFDDEFNDADDEDEEESDPEESAEEIDPELKEEIEQAVADLGRQKSKYRWRAERNLKTIGTPAVPFLLPLVDSPSELTRTVVMRFFSEHAEPGDEGVIEACLSGLDDDTVYVRDYASQALRRLTERNFGFRPTASARNRDAAREKWNLWWESETKDKKKSSDDD